MPLIEKERMKCKIWDLTALDIYLIFISLNFNSHARKFYPVVMNKEEIANAATRRHSVRLPGLIV